MVKKIITILTIITLILITTSCTPNNNDVGVTAKYYDTEGKLIGSQDLTTSITQQAIIIKLNNMPRNTASVSYNIITKNNGEVPITIQYLKAEFKGEYE